jgi:photosystem II stability/assembly factor-like uncharacterized protein
MASLLMASKSGVLRIGPDGVRKEDGPGAVAFLARGVEATFAVSQDGGLWKQPKGGSWSLLADQTVAEEVWAFAADSRLPGRLYLGVSPALVYRSDDEGESWTACDSVKRIPGYETWTFPPPPHIPHVRSIVADPQVMGGVYIGVEEGGVYRSADSGDSWESLNEGLYWDVHNVAPAADASELYATTGAGFHRSEDGGAHWQHVQEGLTHRYTVSLLVSQKYPGRLFTAAAFAPPPSWSQGANAAIFRSENGGRNWHRLEQGLPPRFDAMVTALAEDEAGWVFATAGGEVLVSENGGESWQVLASNLSTPRGLAGGFASSPE